MIRYLNDYVSEGKGRPGFPWTVMVYVVGYMFDVLRALGDDKIFALLRCIAMIQAILNVKTMVLH